MLPGQVDLVEYPHFINTSYSCVFSVLLWVSNNLIIYMCQNEMRWPALFYLYNVTMFHWMSDHNHCNLCNMMYILTWSSLFPSSDYFSNWFSSQDLHVVQFDLHAYTSSHHIHTSPMQVFTLCGQCQNMMGIYSECLQKNCKVVLHFSYHYLCISPILLH